MTGDSYRSEREEARERLRESLDALAERTNLQVQMQKEPLKMLGGASAVGALIGVVAGRQLRRSKKIYVDAGSPVKDQKAFLKAQQRHQGKGGGVGGALVATLGTLAFKALQDRVITPRLEELANNLMERAGQQQGQAGTVQSKPTESKPAQARPALSRPAQTQAAQPQTTSFQTSGSRPAPDWAGKPTQGGKANVQPVIPARPPEGGTVKPVSTGGAASFLKNPAPAGGPPDPASATGSQALNVTASDLPKPAGTVEAKAQGSAIAPEEKVNPNIS
ncbi:hypothetical protein V3W47_11340 [Deinococcus sp. YIM 134068]|uniref:hypothetical protein n=1 Tax=Deinococcus lichenicola TaxID=3118910 RepID=UPI002F959C74